MNINVAGLATLVTFTVLTFAVSPWFALGLVAFTLLTYIGEAQRQ